MPACVGVAPRGRRTLTPHDRPQPSRTWSQHPEGRMDSYAFDSRTRAPIRARRRHGPSTGLLLATLVLYVLLVMAGACSRDASAAVTGPTIQLTMATPQQVAAFMPSLNDVQSRVL